jgi:hypothetical protein
MIWYWYCGNIPPRPLDENFFFFLCFRPGRTGSLRAADRSWTGSVRTGPVRTGSNSDRFDSDRFGSDRFDSDWFGSDRFGSDRFGSDRFGSWREKSKEGVRHQEKVWKSRWCKRKTREKTVEGPQVRRGVNGKGEGG